jgi:hypothetical protein
VLEEADPLIDIGRANMAAGWCTERGQENGLLLSATRFEMTIGVRMDTSVTVVSDSSRALYSWTGFTRCEAVRQCLAAASVCPRLEQTGWH